MLLQLGHIQKAYKRLWRSRLDETVWNIAAASERRCSIVLSTFSFIWNLLLNDTMKQSASPATTDKHLSPDFGE